MSDIDIILMSVIVMLLFIVIEYIANMMTTNNKPNTTECTSVCAVKEHFNTVDTDYAKILSEMGQSATQENKNNEKLPEDVVTRDVDGTYRITTMTPHRIQEQRQVGSRANDGVLKNETQYSDYNSFPQNANTGSFEYGYSFLPPSNWYPVPPHPPVCVTEKTCPVCPVFTSGTNADLKEWDSSRRVTQQDSINVNYVEEKLNSGR
jgi:hypothetical protein